MSGLFNPDDFLNAPMSGANATRSIPLPIAETVAQAIDTKMTSGEYVDKAGEKKRWYNFKVTWEITDLEYLSKWDLRQDDGSPMPKASVTQGIMLDVSPGGGIAMGDGKNIKLGRLREATGTNDVGKTLNDIRGQFARISVTNRPSDEDPTVIFSDVGAVAKA